MCLRICPAASSIPMAYPSTLTLLLMVVRFFTPLRTSARIRFSGIPHRPNPPTMTVAPSKTSRMASSALATTLFIGEIVKQFTTGTQSHKETVTENNYVIPSEARNLLFARPQQTFADFHKSLLTDAV